MRAGEALMIGSMCIKPRRGTFYVPGLNEGCALGMIAIATNGVEQTVRRSSAGLAGLAGFPWMSRQLTVEFPCGCENKDRVMGGGGMFARSSNVTGSVETMIVHLFNQHVIDGDWTIERLADWIESVDPTPKSDQPTTVQERELVAAT
jgi:hypothetical protein